MTSEEMYIRDYARKVRAEFEAEKAASKKESDLDEFWTGFWKVVGVIWWFVAGVYGAALVLGAILSALKG